MDLFRQAGHSPPVLFTEFFIVNISFQNNRPGSIRYERTCLLIQPVHLKQFPFRIENNIQRAFKIRQHLGPEHLFTSGSRGHNYRGHFGVFLCKFQPEGNAHKADGTVRIDKAQHGILPDRNKIL